MISKKLYRQNIDPTNKMLWHHRTFESVLKEFNTHITGLSFAEADERLKLYGNNILPETRKRNSVIIFLRQFHNILIYVLLLSTIVTLFLSQIIDALVIFSVVIVNAIIGFIQEEKAERAMVAIHKMLAPLTTVYRNGERHKIDSKLLVPGDIVLLEAGDKVTADVRLFAANGLFIQEATLTGESIPVEKYIHQVAESTLLGDRSCMAYSGTLITSGQGKGIVIATGANTEIGRINKLLAQVQIIQTPLITQMAIFARWLTLFILLVAILLFVYGYIGSNYSFTEMFMIGVGFSVAAIPEGLPTVITITFAISVQKMIRHHVIVRNLPSVETLGSVSVICTDKTGTLTRNDMMVSSIITDQQLFTADGNSYKPEGSISLAAQKISPVNYRNLTELARSAALCNDSRLMKNTQRWVVEGDPMEGALLAFSGKASIDTILEQNALPRIDSIPFDAKHRFMATLHHIRNDGAVIFVKGAPESILAMCNSQMTHRGDLAPLNTEYWIKQINMAASRGQRILAFATKNLNTQQEKLTHLDMKSLTLLGMTGLIDPPRPEAIAAVAACKMAGIRVKMITGDHAKTACAIGEQIGLQNFHTVLTGHDLDNMTDAKLKEMVLDCDVFARTSPEHKLRLVTALQDNVLTVAMTGDGVNDAPALKRADVGIAMGMSGSEVAKEAAKLILLDDNFASIEAAVREGRTAYDNIKKVIIWTLPTNAGESIIIITAILFNIVLPVTAIQILWINLITSGTLGLALAFEPTEENTMRRPPRSRDEPILSYLILWQIALVSVLFAAIILGIYSYAINIGYTVELARTICLNTLIVLEIFYLFFIRNIYGTSLTWKEVRGTPVIWLALIIIILSQFAVTYVPSFQKIFDTRSVAFIDGLLIIGVGIIFFGIIEIEKQIRLRIMDKSKHNSKKYLTL